MINVGAFLFYAFTVTFTPGPNNIMSMANGSKFGYKKTLEFILGVFTGFIIIMILCSYFNLLLLNLIPRIEVFMSILGTAYMIYLAINIIKSKEDVANQNNKEITTEKEFQKSTNDRKDLTLFFNGMTLQFVNPKAILYSITVISNFIVPYYKSNIALILFSVFLALLAFISTSLWALFGSLFNKFLSKYRNQFNIVMGLLLIYCAISISGITHLFY